MFIIYRYLLSEFRTIKELGYANQSTPFQKKICAQYLCTQLGQSHFPCSNDITWTKQTRLKFIFLKKSRGFSTYIPNFMFLFIFNKIKKTTTSKNISQFPANGIVLEYYKCLSAEASYFEYKENFEHLLLV